MTSTGPRKYIVPGTSSPRPSVAVVRDTSGSMSFSQLAVATREVEAISKRLGIRGQDLRVLDVDASVAQARPFNRSHDFDDAYGGGGTDMRVGITAAAELRPPPSLIVVVTDGWTPWPRQPVGVPVIACLVGPDADHAEGSIPDFIKTVKVSE